MKKNIKWGRILIGKEYQVGKNINWEMIEEYQVEKNINWERISSGEEY